MTLRVLVCQPTSATRTAPAVVSACRHCGRQVWVAPRGQMADYVLVCEACADDGDVLYRLAPGARVQNDLEEWGT